MKTNLLTLMAFSIILFGVTVDSAEKVIDAGGHIFFQNQNNFGN